MKSKELTILEGIRGETKSKSDRMSVTASCALVIKRVTEEDAGHYTCLQYTRNARYPLSTFSLGFVRMTENKNGHSVRFTCFAPLLSQCKQSIYWNLNRDFKLTLSAMWTKDDCSSHFIVFTSEINQTFYDMLECKVKSYSTDEVMSFPFMSKSSGDNVTTAATVMTVTNNNPTNHQDFMIRCAVVSVGLAALIIFVVTVNMWAKTTVKKTQMEENTEFIQ
ncbi:uncharacterized protein KZ484_013283 isoform 1-T1 [Pholidichthys leucotaenia]